MTVALLSPCGWGNLGDAAIMAAAIDQIRARRPEAEVVAITLNPIDTQQRHGIPAFGIDAFTLAGFSVDRAGLKGARRLGQRLLRRVRGVSCRLANALCRALNVVTLPGREIWHWWSSYRLVRSCRVIVVCGGGQIDELWGGPWGHPYALFKFAFLSRLTGARFVVLSSGSAKLKSQVGKWFVTRALRLADYRSFREQFAVDLARELGAPEPNLCVPDLAFSLDVGLQRVMRRGDRPIVGVSPIAWLDPKSWPEKDGKRYEEYFAQLADFVRTLLARKNQVVLFATAAADHAVVADLVRVLREDGIPGLDELLSVSAARTVPDLLDVLARVDVVVASRLHGVVLCYACCLPVVAVSYDPKVEHLVESFHQQEACLSIDTLESGRLREILDQVYATREVISQRLAMKVAESQELLSAQYDRIFGLIGVEDSGNRVDAESTVLQAQPIA
jgi:polysaccharide pyruvyl transferase WcaK-like protein